MPQFYTYIVDTWCASNSKLKRLLWFCPFFQSTWHLFKVFQLFAVRLYSYYFYLLCFLAREPPEPVTLAGVADILFSFLVHLLQQAFKMGFLAQIIFSYTTRTQFFNPQSVLSRFRRIASWNFLPLGLGTFRSERIIFLTSRSLCLLLALVIFSLVGGVTLILQKTCMHGL